MPAEVYEDSIELQIGLLEALIPTSREGFGDSYPFPPLKLLDRVETRNFRTVVLENPYLRATFVPDLGGRMLCLFDKRTGTEILYSGGPLLPQSGTRRGAYLPDGIQLQLDGEDRLDSMAYAPYLGQPASDEDDEAAVWFSQLGVGVSYHIRWSMPAGAARVTVECRLLNRTYLGQRYNPGLAVQTRESHIGDRCGLCLFNAEKRSGALIWSDSDSMNLVLSGGQARMLPFPGDAEPYMAPRQTHQWINTVIPFSGFDELPEVYDEAAVRLTHSSLRFQPAEPFPDHKFLLLTEDEQTMEAAADLRPEETVEIALSGLPSPPQEVALVSPSGKMVLKSKLSSGEFDRRIGPNIAPSYPLDTWKHIKEEDVYDKRTWHVAGLRQAGYLIWAEQVAIFKNYKLADEYVEKALLYSGDDHLAWWLKALIVRLSRQGSEDQPELLNAHYLAPLEPVLRAESFLAQSQQASKDPNPILNTFRETPEAFVEVACLLLGVHLYEEAHRWIDEAVRHVDLPMLRYLQAYIFVVESEMRTEAAIHLQAAAKLPFAPPFPWREVEKDALTELRSYFPSDERLAQYAALVGA